MSGRPERSHAPLVAILGGTALLVIATCAGVVSLVTRSVRGLGEMIEARRGPTEVLDVDYRVRLALGEDARPSTELWGPELARGWDPAGILVLRDETCAAGVAVTPASGTRTLADQLGSFVGDVPTRLAPPPRGASGEALVTYADEDGGSTYAFVHEGVLYRVIGEEPCTSRLRASLEVLAGPVVPRWTTPPVENEVGRSYRVVDRVFESAATGLRVDGTEPFSIELDDLTRAYRHAEVAMRHRNGVVVSLDPVVGTYAGVEDESADAILVRILDGEVRLEQADPEVMAWYGRATRGELRVLLGAFGPDRERVVAALEALAPRIEILDAPSLARLRASMPPPSDRRAGRTWSLRDGVFREHPVERRPRVELVVPEWAEVVAGLELAVRDEVYEVDDGSVLTLERRDLGLGARLLVARAGSATATAELGRWLAAHGVDGEHPSTGDAAHAWAEVPPSEGAPAPFTRRVEVFLRDGWSFVLELWWSPVRDALARAYAAGVVQLLAIEAPAPSTYEGRDERLGFRLDGATFAPILEAPFPEALSLANAVHDGRGLMVVAASHPSVSAGRSGALEELDAIRPIGVLGALPAEPITFGGRTGTVRTIDDPGATTRVVEVRIDRTTYLIVVRSVPGAGWRTELERVSL